MRRIVMAQHWTSMTLAWQNRTAFVLCLVCGVPFYGVRNNNELCPTAYGITLWGSFSNLSSSYTKNKKGKFCLEKQGNVVLRCIRSESDWGGVTTIFMTIDAQLWTSLWQPPQPYVVTLDVFLLNCGAVPWLSPSSQTPTVGFLKIIPSVSES